MSQAKLLRARKFYPLFWTQFCGAFNDNFLKNALVILITFKTTQVLGIPAEQMVAVSGGIFILPFFLFSATAGQLADKYEKGRIIRLIKLAEIAIMVLASVGFLTGQYGFLLLVLFLMGLHSTFFGPVKYSILPQHLSESELVGGNALVEAGTFLAILLGTIGGGVLIGVRDIGPLAVSAGLLVVATIGYFASRGIPEAPPVDPNLQVEWNPIPPTMKIFGFLRGNRAVYLSILAISWFWFFGAAMLSLFPHYCKDVLHADESVVTLFLATFSIGIGIGSLLCERLSREQLELGLVPFGSIGITVFTGDLAFQGAGPLGFHILADLFLLSVFSGFFIVPLYTLIQERSEKSHRSRIIAANNVINALFMVGSAGALVGMMRMGLSIPKMFLTLAILNGLVSIYVYTVLPEFLLRFCIWIVANLLYRLKVEGTSKIPKQGAAILVCNHISFVDWMIIAAGVKRPARFVMHQDFYKKPLMKMLLDQGKVIPIAGAKENPELLKRAFERIAEELRNGELVCIFPEGKITWDGKLNVFRPGIEKVLAETPVPVVPMALVGMWGSIFSRKDGAALSRFPRRIWFRVILRVGEVMTPQQANVDSLFSAVSRLISESGHPEAALVTGSSGHSQPG